MGIRLTQLSTELKVEAEVGKNPDIKRIENIEKEY